MKKDVRLQLLDENTDIPFGTATVLETYRKGEERNLPGGGKGARKQSGFKMDHEKGNPHYVGAATLARLHMQKQGQFFVEDPTIDEETGEGSGMLLPSVQYRVTKGQIQGLTD